MVSKRFVWHGLAKDVRQWARSCLSCQRSKIHRHVKSEFGKFALPPTRFAHVHVDLVGPLPYSGGFQYLLTAVDRHTRWPEAVPLRDITAESCARAFLETWVARFGVPSHITSDRGGQFVSGLWTQLAEACGVEAHRTTSFHPQANGMVERFHRQLKASLTARLTSSTWVKELPWVLLGLRTVPKEDFGCSTAELVYGTALRVPGEFVQEAASEVPTARLQQLRDKLSALMPTPPRWQRTAGSGSEREIPGLLKNAGYVFVRVDAVKPPLSRQYDGPFRVLEKGPKTFKLALGGREDFVSVDRLKRAYTDEEPQTTQATGSSTQTSIPAIPRRSGRDTRPPKRFQNFAP